MRITTKDYRVGQNSAQCLHMSWTEDEGSIFLRNAGAYLQVHTALHPKAQNRHLHRRENLKSHKYYIYYYCSVFSGPEKFPDKGFRLTIKTEW
jgi:hypothetical protein